MNIILLDEDKLFLEDNKCKLKVSGKSLIYVNNIEGNVDIEILLSDDSDVKVFDYNTKKKDVNINVIQHNNSKFCYIHTFKINDEYKFNYKVIMNGDNNINEVNIYGVCNGSASIDVDGVISEHSKNNELNENIKVLTDGGKANISPMLHVNSLDVIANHNTAISNVREDELFYLMSKGIDKKNAKNLIQDSYVYGILKRYDEDFYNLVKE